MIGYVVSAPVFGIGFTIFMILFSSRTPAHNKDFLYLNPSHKWRRLLFIRKIPYGEISFASLAFQCWLMATLFLQLASLLAHMFGPVVVLGFVFFPGAILIILYELVCILFAPKKQSGNDM